jgi:excisionase family DNA binding protein
MALDGSERDRGNLPVLLLRVDEVARMLSICRSKAYELVGSGQILGVVRIGRSVRVHRAMLCKWVDTLAGESPSPAGISKGSDDVGASSPR